MKLKDMSDIELQKWIAELERKLQAALKESRQRSYEKDKKQKKRDN
jgi:hypothetical protein